MGFSSSAVLSRSRHAPYFGYNGFQIMHMCAHGDGSNHSSSSSPFTVRLPDVFLSVHQCKTKDERMTSMVPASETTFFVVLAVLPQFWTPTCAPPGWDGVGVSSDQSEDRRYRPLHNGHRIIKNSFECNGAGHVASVGSITSFCHSRYRHCSFKLMFYAQIVHDVHFITVNTWFSLI